MCLWQLVNQPRVMEMVIARCRTHSQQLVFMLSNQESSRVASQMWP